MVFQTRHPSWIILCYVWLLRFAHTGEAQAAKEGKMMEKQSLFWLIYLAVYLLVRGTAGRASGAGRPSSAGSPPPHLSGCFWPAGGLQAELLPAACSRAPGPSARRERDIWLRQSERREQ